MIFHLLEVVGRYSETLLQLGKNLNKTTQRVSLTEAKLKQFIVGPRVEQH